MIPRVALGLIAWLCQGTYAITLPRIALDSFDVSARSGRYPLHASLSSRSLSSNVGGNYWPSGRGSVGSYSVSPYAFPWNLTSSFSYSWHHPSGLYHTAPTGLAIDDQNCTYLTALDGIRKFSPDGQVVWEYLPQRLDLEDLTHHDGGRASVEEFPDAAALWNGAVFCSTTQGWAFALSMQDGTVLWRIRLANSIDMNNGFVSADNGIVIVANDCASPPVLPGNTRVSALNAADGSELWTYVPDNPVWNFLGSFDGVDSVTFQDMTGKAYRIRLSDGSLIWKNGGVDGTWTDASSMLGSNNVVYAMNNNDNILSPDSRKPQVGAPGEAPGSLSAYDLTDGALLWQVITPRPPNNVCAVGQLFNQSGLSVVQPIGQQGVLGFYTDVYAYDATTGDLQWVFNGPAQQNFTQAGDAEGMADRVSEGLRPLTLPNPWSAPTIDSNGVVYIGNQEGQFYALRDTNHDGIVSGDGEVSVYETGGCFAGSSSPAHAPGRLVIANVASMYVFAEP